MDNFSLFLGLKPTILEQSFLQISLLKIQTELKYHKNYIRNILNNDNEAILLIIIKHKNYIKGYK